MEHKQNLSEADERVRAAYEHLRNLVNRVDSGMMKRDDVPSKRQTKLRGPITRGGAAAYGTIKLGGRRTTANRWSLPALINMIAADDGVTREATAAEQVRLRRTAQNANTTARSRMWGN